MNQLGRIARYYRLLYSLAGEERLRPATVFFRTVELEVVLSEVRPFGRLLDVGCGSGGITRVLRPFWPDVQELVGFDLDGGEVRQARTKSLYDELVVCPGDRTPFPSGSFDFLFSNSVLEHIADLDSVLKELSRVLKPTGRFAFTVPTANLPDLLLGPRLPATLYLPKTRTAYVDEFNKRTDVPYYRSLEQWEELLRSSGFSVDRAIPYLSPVEIRIWEYYANSTGGLVYALHGGRKKLEHIEQNSAALSRPTAVSTFLNLLLGIPVLTQGLLARQLERNPSAHGCVLITGGRR
ncbi:MAG: methyltransferase domain-containing protein [Vulcanimicrobiota bacterium]